MISVIRLFIKPKLLNLISLVPVTFLIINFNSQIYFTKEST